MRIFIISLSAVLYTSLGFCQQNLKTAIAVLTYLPPRIDGVLNDSCWNKANPITEFVQFEPDYLAQPRQKTSVKILYDNHAIYIAAMMFDTAPDSILKQSGSRDDELNADMFGIGFDTYNQQSDAYMFFVWASGVQSDFRITDKTYNTVWQSEVKILDNGWSCEMKIPYSALRFPILERQIWGMNIIRTVRRYRGEDFWSPLEKGAQNDLLNWGTLSGITNIRPPLRLSLTPYLSASLDHYPFNMENKSNFSKSFSGGLDLKYGINDAFTVDVSLLPDFSQIQSDNLIKNLSAYETVFEENRPFFNEAIDLFQKGNLFYSRRIGKTPFLFFAVEDSLKTGEKIIDNPSAVRLLNATKISGRDKSGLAFGFFNAVTDASHAEIEDSVGHKRKIQTEPLTDYSIIVFDKVMKNNSSAYLTQSTVLRGHKNDAASVTASGITLFDKKNKFQIKGNGALSQQMRNTGGDTYSNQAGYKYGFGIGKVSGCFQTRFNHSVMSNTWDANDLGLTLYNNEIANDLTITYNSYKPIGIFRNSRNSISFIHAQNFQTKKIQRGMINMTLGGTLMNYLSIWAGVQYSPEDVHDYYEPRTPNQYSILPSFFTIQNGISPDYRNAFVVDFKWHYTHINDFNFDEYQFNMEPRIRIGNNLWITGESSYTIQNNERGYVNTIMEPDSTNTIVYGRRNVYTFENMLAGRYMFKNDLSLSMRVRHYWSAGQYKCYYKLQDNGTLQEDEPVNTLMSSIPDKNNFNFNAFNIDLVFQWQFAPGSNISLVWKNAILNENVTVVRNYLDNLTDIFNFYQLNSISLKVLYYFDANYLRSKKNSSTQQQRK